MKFSRLVKTTAAMLSLAVALGCTACAPDKQTPTPEPKVNYADVFVFMGQSNMAGRGEAADAIDCEWGHGYEYRAVRAVTRTAGCIPSRSRSVRKKITRRFRTARTATVKIRRNGFVFLRSLLSNDGYSRGCCFGERRGNFHNPMGARHVLF